MGVARETIAWGWEDFHLGEVVKVDRERMNRAIFAALKPGGAYVLVDHSSAQGKGLSEVETLHRIEESILKAEIEQAGFRFVASADFLRSPSDTRDWSASPRFAGEKRGTSVSRAAHAVGALSAWSAWPALP